MSQEVQDNDPIKYLKYRSKLYTNFVDILFAIVLGQSFVYLASSDGISSWINAPSSNLIPIGDTILGFALIVTSWIRYHPSVEKFPHKSPIRFVLDLALLLFYFLIFVYVKSFFAVSIIFVIVFSIYSVWTAVRWYEYKGCSKKYHFLKRTLQPTVFTAIFASIAILLQFVSDQVLEEICLVFSFVLLIVFGALSRKTALAASGVEVPTSDSASNSKSRRHNRMVLIDQ